MVLDTAIQWFKDTSDKIDDKLYNSNKKVQRIGKRVEENCNDTGDLIADSFVPRKALDPKDRIEYIGSQSRVLTGASREKRARHSTDKQVTEKRMRAVDKIHRGMSSTVGESIVAGEVVAISHPHHAITKCGDAAAEAAKLSTQFIKDAILVNEMNRRRLSEADCRKPTPGMFEQGFMNSAPRVLKKAVIKKTVHEVKEYAGIPTSSDYSDYSSTQTSVPAYSFPREISFLSSTSKY